MREEIEIQAIDRKYESHRLRQAGQEKQLLVSIASRGIDQPLQGVRESDRAVLLDGFKRLRCALTLGLSRVPFVPIGETEVTGIVALLKISNAGSLSLLEQARLVDELKRSGRLTVSDISARLERSKAWVIARLDVLSQMSEHVREEIFSGRFPAYSYLYTLRQFRRLAHAKQAEENDFVSAVSGKNLSTRDIEHLARGFFMGGAAVREQIRHGHLGWCLAELKQQDRAASESRSDLSELERGVLRDLEITGRVMSRLCLRLPETGSSPSGFFAEAGLLASGIERRLPSFSTTIRQFYDRSRQT